MKPSKSSLNFLITIGLTQQHKKKSPRKFNDKIVNINGRI